MKYAIIVDDKVSNIILADEDFETEETIVPCGDFVSIGWSYVGGEFISPPIILPVPETVSPTQMRLALLELDKLELVDGFVASQGAEVEIRWRYATEIRRDNATIAAGAALLDWSSEYIDELFRLAESKVV